MVAILAIMVIYKLKSYKKATLAAFLREKDRIS